jgi:signal transduction histidine kinase/CheY-like chemotaxis protein
MAMRGGRADLPSPNGPLGGDAPAEGGTSAAAHAEDIVGSREQLIRIGMAAVAIACAIFAAARAWSAHTTGAPTPWWANLGAGAAVALLYVWFRRAPERRSSAAVHGTAAIASVALLIPSAYGMASSKWWLSLVGFAVLLMGRRSEAVLWAPLTLVLVPATALLEPLIQIEGAAGEPALERALAGLCYVGILLGITAAFRVVARRRAAELAETAASLERAARVRNRFLARMSHELRTPLHAVLSMTELALRRSPGRELREPIETAQQSASHLLGLLNDILDVTRAEADATVLNRAPFALHATLSELLRGPAAEARGRRIQFDAQADPGIIEARVGDRTRVVQVVLNLVANALKFTERGSVRVRLEAVPERPERVRVSVQDTGRGIAPDKLAAVFEPFEQAFASDSELQRGAGLGLAIVRELARLMGGNVSVTSELGSGSTFVVELDLPPEDPGGTPGPVQLLATRVSGPVPKGPTLQPLRILVCEDDPAGLRAVCALLRLRGHAVTPSRDALDALERLERADYDLLITDVEMPGIDGIELVRRIRERERDPSAPRLPILVTTAHAGEDDARALYAAGADAHIVKPFTLDGLEVAVAAALGALRAAVG